MLVKKLKKPLLHHLLNSRHRWQEGIPDVEAGLGGRGLTFLLWKLSSPHITFSQLRWGENFNGIDFFSPPRALLYGNLCRER